MRRRLGFFCTLLIFLISGTINAAQELKQSTEVIVDIGSFVDVGDGITPETGITLGAADEKVIRKHGGTTASIVSATWSAVGGMDGWYDLTLSVSSTDTLGMLTVVVQDDSVCLPVFKDFQVVTANYWGSKYSTDKLQVHVVEMTGSVITAAAIATDAIDADALKADAATQIIDDFETQSQADPTGFHVHVLEMTDNVVTAAVIAASAIGVSEFAAEADNIGINWADISNPTTSVNLSGTTIATCSIVTNGLTTSNVNVASGIVEANIEQIENDNQSSVDLKDFADAGYDPGNDRVVRVYQLTELDEDNTTIDLDGITIGTASNVTAVATDVTTILADTAAQDTSTELRTLLTGTDTTLSTVTTAQVNAQVLDVIFTDIFAEMSQGAPPASPTVVEMLNYIYRAYRNKTEVTSASTVVYDDAGSTVLFKSVLADDSVTFTKGEYITGP